jgi:pyrimidine-specific ribonucleoside hydrolase
MSGIGIGAIGMSLLLWGSVNAGTASDSPATGRPFLVLKSLPLDAHAYCDEARMLVRKGVPAKYGQEEWDSVVLTHELHQHLGIYTTLGAKMGVRARELLNAPMRSVHVIAETGREEPLSCMVDGIQVALASTLAQGLIEVPDSDRPSPSATFRYGEKTIRLRLKEEAADRVQEIIRRASKAHGFKSPAYFEAIEAESFDVWADFDRHEVFEVVPSP